MADLTQTSANVGLTDKSASTVPQRQQAGEALTPGEPCYLSAVDNKYYKASANSIDEANVKGIVGSPCAADEYFVMYPPGSDVDVGATLTVGATYYASINDGAIADAAPGSAKFSTILGKATSTGNLSFNPNPTNVANA